MTWEEAINEYLLYMQGNGRKLSTMRRYRYDLVQLAIWIENSEDALNLPFYRDITTEQFKNYYKVAKHMQNRSAASLKRIMSVIINFLDYHSVFLDSVDRGREILLKLDNFAPDNEIEKLLCTMNSFEGLTNYQVSGRKFIINRNLFLVRLMICYGFSIHDLTTLTMQDINFGQGTLMPVSAGGIKRAIPLNNTDRHLLVATYKDIPESVRPRQNTNDPFFVTFHHATSTFQWDYSTESPKKLTKIAIQRMLQKEIKRAGIHHLSPTTLRNRHILDSLRDGVNFAEIKVLLGMKSIEAMHRYIVFWRSFTAVSGYKKLWRS
ncbi:site-specific integrase [Bacillus thuringiensis]|uniref:Integrase n=3 Tax=root TaxID=1 RepID=A0A4P8MVH8_9CAUD|nr:site-specific integrase [Bacillus thuringiensis]YP_009845469.1 site-specific integrase [Bacillus phage vB_BtS_B83]AQY42371.1 integrase [Bacillus thuringiensis]MDR4148545.1 site-specific integrase [Bacillus thuringiensis]MEC3575129.1 site-specific integrase [Bacillus thuringiensis]MED2021949.1 site-specific integrase [Bacillus thuringiensis]MED2140733.1 site-specific integrase [Bacillus thuringiensis]